MNKLIFLIAMLLVSISVGAQKPSLSGTIYYEGKPLAGANVSIYGNNAGASSDDNGGYHISGIEAGTYDVRVSYIGFITIEETIELKEGQNIVRDFTMIDDALEIENVVLSGTRNQIERYKSPVIVNTISNRTFETTQSLSISEGLNFSPGLRVETNCQNCGFSQLRMNGLEGSYSQVLVNSRPVFSALAGVYGLEMLPTNMVDRIEVVRGGGSVLYGGNAIGGTVNIITKDPIDNAFEVGINQAFTHFDTPDRTISMNGSIVSDDLDKGITLFGYNRSRSPWDANGDTFSELTKIRNNTFGFDAFWNTTEISKLKLGMYSINEFRRGGNKFELEPHQSDVTEQLDHKILNANISFEQYSKDLRHKFSIYGSTQLVNRGSYYGGGGRVLTPKDTVSQDDIVAINAYGKSEDVSAVAGLQYNYDINPVFNLSLGSEYQVNNVIDKMPGYKRLIDQHVSTIGTYAQLEVKPMEKLTLLLGGRYDNINIDGRYRIGSKSLEDKKNLNVFIPRVSAMYSISDGLKFRASYAQGYRAPQAFDEDLHIETVGGDVRFIRLSPDLKVEKSNSITGSINYGKRLGDVQLNLVAEGFYTKLKNPFILGDQKELPSGIAVITKRNGSGATVQGANLEANVAFGSQFVLQSGATIQSALYAQREEVWAPENPDDKTPATFTDRILRTPNAYGYVTIAYNPLRELSLSYSGVITGTMDVPHVVDSETERTVIKKTPTFFENNIKVSYDINTGRNFGVQVYAGVHNILNSYQSDFDRGADRDAGYIYGPTRPRTAFMGLKLGLN